MKKIQNWLQSDFLPQRLLISGNGEAFEEAIMIAEKKLKISSLKEKVIPDVLMIPDDGESFKMRSEPPDSPYSAQGVIRWVSQKPVLDFRIVLFENLERVTPQALQSWLKILEEPPPKAIFIFTTQNHYQIPSTILSRMTVVSTAPKTPKETENQDIITFLETKNLFEKLKYIDHLHENSKKEGRSVFQNFMNELLEHSRNSKQRNCLESVFEAFCLIQKNINHRLVLEQLAISLSMK